MDYITLLRVLMLYPTHVSSMNKTYLFINISVRTLVNVRTLGKDKILLKNKWNKINKVEQIKERIHTENEINQGSEKKR